MSGSWWGKSETLLQTVAQHGENGRGLGEWVWEPSVIFGIDILVALYVFGYLYGTGRRARGDRSFKVSKRQISLFLAGTLVLFLALVSPLDVWSDEYLFSAHMAQHILLATVVPALWLLGTPGWMLRPLINNRAMMRAARAFTAPVAAFLVFNLNFWLWHWPPLYDIALADERIHILQHLTFIGAGALNWWPVLGTLSELPRPNFPRQLIYLAANCQPGVALGAILTFSNGVFYQTYGEAPRVFGISALTDQQIGGLTMWIPGNAIYLIALSLVFMRWMSEGEKDSSQQAV